MINQIKQDSESKMKRAIEALNVNMTKIRTGRASAGLLDHIQVDYYGSLMPLNQVATVAIADSRTLTVTPWEKTMLAVIEKAILTSDLGLNPATSGNMLRVPMPALTEERRKELIKVVRAEGEQSKVSLRNIRRDANNQLEKLKADKLVSEDEQHRGEELIQKLIDKHIAEIDSILKKKEEDLMQI